VIESTPRAVPVPPPAPRPEIEAPPAPAPEAPGSVPLPDIFGKLGKAEASAGAAPEKPPEIEPTVPFGRPPRKEPEVRPARKPPTPLPKSTGPQTSMPLPDIFSKLTPAGPAPTIETPTPSPITPRQADPAPTIQPAPPLGGSKEEIPGSAIDGTILGAQGDHLEFRVDDLSEPILVLPTPGDASRYGPGPARVVLEASARRFNRTMGTARAVQIQDGKPVRFTGLVTRIESQRGLVLVDVGYPVVVRDLSGHSAALTPGSGVMIPAEGPTRAIVLSS
jgi:hypothetical protein